MAIGILGLLVGMVLAVVGLTILYFVIRYAVRDGVIDAHYKLDSDRVRAELRIGPERSPNSRG
ncbi:DUF6019 family protein [Nocardioides aquiterrae]|uniref:Uncharacterized protein n=1 Tax=Nocardioides aquiterrae TaxID=203799 RepID=A0ABN1UHE2_9ACTN